MSEEIKQRGYVEHGYRIGDYEYYVIGNTTLRQLKKYKIIPDKDYGYYETRKPDALFVDRRNLKKIKVIAVIENKDDSTFLSENDRLTAIRQANDVAQLLEADIAVATDTLSYIWANPKQESPENDYNDEKGVKRSFSYIRDEQKQILDAPFEIAKKDLVDGDIDEKTKNTLGIITKLRDVLSDYNSSLREEETNDPTPLAKQIWQDIWSVSGEEPQACLYTFVELFIFKYLSDLGVLDKTTQGIEISFKDVYNKGKDAAFKFYVGTVRTYLKKIFPEDRNKEEGGTTIINGTVLKEGVHGHDEVFFKILERFKNYGELKKIDPKFKSNLFESFLKRDLSVKKWGQFFTPRKIVRSIVDMSGIDSLPDGAKVCDPFCGVGGFVLEPLLSRRAGDFYVQGNKVKSRIEYYGYDKGFVDKEQKTIILAKANMLIFLSDLIKGNSTLTVEFAHAFNNTFRLRTGSILGTLDLMKTDEDYTGEYDLIMTNPPYAVSGSDNLKKVISSNPTLSSFYNTKSYGVEGLSIQWIIKNLKRGTGKAFIIVPDGVFNRIPDKDLRRFIARECNIDCIISLPSGAFFTTDKPTYILGLTRKNAIQTIQTEPVFAYLVSNIGETLNVNRFDIEENDLVNAKNLFNQFKNAKDTFVSNDKRCKIIKAENFINDYDNWIINNYWSKEEKIELGMLEEKEILTINSFNKVCDSTLDEIDEIQKQLDELNKSLLDTYTTKPILLGDGRYFTLIKGKSKYTKEYINKNKGEYPVYSSQTTNDGIIGSIDAYDFDKQCLTWTTDGTYVGTVFLRDGKFSMTTHCGAVVINHPDIDLSFLYHTLSKSLPAAGVGEGSNRRVTVKQAQKVTIDIPVNTEGKFDLEVQKKLAQKLSKVKELKAKMNILFSKLVKLDITI